MKQLSLFFAMTFIVKMSFAQMSGTDYAFTTDVRVYRWDETTQKAVMNDTLYRATRGTKYTIRQKVTYTNDKGKSFTGYRISFWDFNDNNKQNVEPSHEKVLGNEKGKAIKLKIIDKTQNGQMFFINEEDAKNNATDDFKKPRGLFKVDGVVLPVKLRFKNSLGGTFDIGQSISVGPAVNFNINYGGAFSQNTLSFLAGANVSSITVDEKTVPGVITSKTTALGLTPFAGINWEYHNVSLGIMSGIDILSGKAQDAWVYRGCPWVGFTIGTSLISTTKKSNKSDD